MLQRFFHPQDNWHAVPDIPEPDVEELILLLCYVIVCLVFPILNAFLFID